MKLVIGAHGTVGRSVVRGLAELGEPIRALVRSAHAHPAWSSDGASHAQVEVLVGSAGHTAVLDCALRDVDAVFIAIGNSPEQETIERTVIDACAAAKVARFVKVSAPYVAADVPVAIARMHGRLEQHATELGLAGTFLRPFAFLQNLLNIAPQVAHTGMFVGSAGDAQMNFVDARDVAAVAVRSLVEPEGGHARAVVLTGPNAFTYDQVAAAMRRHGIAVRYVDLPSAEHRAGLERMQLPEWLVDHLTELDALARARRQQPNHTIEQILGRPPRTLDSFIEEHASSFRARSCDSATRPSQTTSS